MSNKETTPVPITVAYGDGIGPEIMDATLNIITAGGANLDIDVVEIGEAVYKRGITSNASGVSANLAAPISTIQCSDSISGYSSATSSNTL